MEQMPMWCPPTPPQQDTDIYIDHAMSFMYDTSVMSESQLPPIYVKKEAKRARHEAGFVDSRRPSKIQRKDDAVVNVPKSIFHSSTTLKLKQRDIKLKYRGLMRNTLPIPGKVALPKPAIETPLWHDWTVHEDMALLKVIQSFQGLPLNLVVGSPGHTPNWDFVADYVNTVSITYRSPKQCRHRYETVLIQREEGKQVMENSMMRKKKNKASPGMQNKFAFTQKSNRPMRTSQLYTQDNNASFSQDMIRRYDAFKAIANKRLPPQRSSGATNSSAPLLKNPKHTAMLTECGIDLEHPVLPVEVAARRAERLQREKKPMTPEQQQLATIRMMKGLLPLSQTPNSATTAAAVSAASNQSGAGASGAAVSAAVAGQQVAVTTQTVNVVATVAAAASTNVSATPPNAIRSQRIISSPLQAQTVVSVSGLSPAQLQAATQRLIVANSPGQKSEGGQATAIQAKSISPAQLQLIRQQGTFKPHLRLQTGSLTAQGVKNSTVTIGGQQTVVQFTQAQPRGQQFVRQGTVTVGGKTGITRTVDCEVSQLLKKQQQKTISAAVGGGGQATGIQGLPSQVLAQAVQQAGSSGTPVATLVKTVSNSGGVSQTVTIPVSGVTLTSGGKAMTQTIKGTTSQQLRQFQIHQQHLLAQKKLTAQKLNIAQVSGKNNVQTQLIVGPKPLSTAMTVQQLTQVIRTPISLGRTPVVLAKGSPRVIPVNTSQGTKQTIQVVAATSQALSSALRPQASSTLAGALAGIKVQGQGSSQAQQALLSQVSAALQNQTVAVRQGSPVRLQTTSGASIVAVTVQPTSSMQHQQQQQQQQQQQGGTPQQTSSNAEQE